MFQGRKSSQKNFLVWEIDRWGAIGIAVKCLPLSTLLCDKLFHSRIRDHMLSVHDSRSFLALLELFHGNSAKSLILSLEDGPGKKHSTLQASLNRKRKRKSSPSPRNRLQKWSNQVKYLETWRSTYHKTAYYGKEK